MSRRIVVLCMLALCALVFAPPLLAHANLVRSEPAANAAVPASPGLARLWFSEDVEPGFSSARVVDSAGAVVSKGDSHRMPDDPKGMEVSLPDLSRGIYTVVWETLSAVDGHTASGSFAFAVGDTAPVESSPRAVIALVDAAVAAAEPPAIYQVGVRWLNVLSLVLLAGLFWFPVLVLMPALKAGGGLGLLSAWAASWRMWLWGALLLTVVATVALLLMQVQAVGGLDTLGRVLTGTRFGMLWSVRVALLLALVVSCVRARQALGDAPDRIGSAVYGLVGGLLVVQALNSHAAAVDDPPLAAMLVDLVHLAGAAVWLGGLAQLVFVVPQALRALEWHAQLRIWTPVIAHFSRVALAAVGVISLTGIYATLVQVGSFEALVETRYGGTLLAKLALMALMLAAAAFNLRVASGALAEAAVARAALLLRGFRIASFIEVVGGVGVLLAVGVLTTIAPGRAAYDPNPKVLTQTQPVNDLVVTLGAAPGTVGPNDFDVLVRNRAGQPVPDATVVRILATQLDMAMGTQEATAQAQGGGHYTLHSDLFSMRGNWTLEVLVRRDGRDDARVSFAWLARTSTSSASSSPNLLVLQDPQALFGFGLALAGVVAGAALALNRQVPRRSRFISAGAVLVVVVLGGASVARAPSVSATLNPVAGNLFVPPNARAVRSPLSATSDAVAAGKQIFQTNCVVCHGPQGRGNGPLAVSLNPRPADLTIHVPLHSDGELFYWVSNGIAGTAMPAWAAQLDETTRWQVIMYLRVLAPAAPTPVP